MKGRHCVGATAGFVCVLISAIAWAQTDARIVGTVSDTSGGIIPGVAVIVKSEKTGAERSVLTNDKGAFAVTPLAAATYTVKADQPGFSRREYSGIIVQAGQEKNINIVLQPAGVAAE